MEGQDDADAVTVDEGADDTSTDADGQQPASPTALPGDAALGFYDIAFFDLRCSLPGGYEEYQDDDSSFDKRLYFFDREEDEWWVTLTRYTLGWEPATYDELLKQYQDARGNALAEHSYVTDYTVNTEFTALGGLMGLDSYAEYSGPDQPFFCRTLDVCCYHPDDGRSVHYQVDVTWLKDEPWFSQSDSYWGFLGVYDESLTSIRQT